MISIDLTNTFEDTCYASSSKYTHAHITEAVQRTSIVIARGEHWII